MLDFTEKQIDASKHHFNVRMGVCILVVKDAHEGLRLRSRGIAPKCGCLSSSESCSGVAVEEEESSPLPDSEPALGVDSLLLLLASLLLP